MTSYSNEIFETGSARVVRCGDGIVILDLEADSYSCIYHCEPLCSAEIVSVQCETSLPAQPDFQHFENILADLGRDFRWADRRAHGNGWTDAETEVVERLRPIDLVRFVYALVRASVVFRKATVLSLLRRAATMAPDVPRTATASPADVASRFERLWLFLPFQPQCLFRSLCLLHYLRLYGLDADWVFGVRLFPFSAHCWLATDAQLIGERSHRIAIYEPILILRRPHA